MSRRALLQKSHTFLLKTPILRFWIARLSFLSVSQFLSAFNCGPMSHAANQQYPRRSQNIVAVTLPAKLVCLGFHGLVKRNVTTHVTIESKTSHFVFIAPKKTVESFITLPFVFFCNRGIYIAHTFQYFNFQSMFYEWELNCREDQKWTFNL